MDHVDFHREPPTNLTTLIVAFSGWINAGRAATGTLRHLVRHLSASHLASIDPEDFFMFSQERPEVRLTDEGDRLIEWPSSQFFTYQPDADQEGLLLFNSREPHLNWRTFIKTLFDVAEQCGVKQMVSIGAYLAGTPHTRPPQVTARTTAPAWRSLLEEWGIYQRPQYEGPTGISLVVLNAATQRGIPHLDFMGQAPHYLQGAENPAVKQALLSYVSRLLNLELDLSRLDGQIKAFRTQCDQAIADTPAIVSHVQELEQAYDATVHEESTSHQGDALDSEALIQDVEKFLREEREGGTEG